MYVKLEVPWLIAPTMATLGELAKPPFYILFPGKSGGNRRVATAPGRPGHQPLVKGENSEQHGTSGAPALFYPFQGWWHRLAGLEQF